MIVILKEDVSNLGFKDEIVTVKDGYGRNFLIPRGLAVVASESAKKVLAENQKQRAHKLAQIKADAEALASKMEGTTFTIKTKTSSTGTIFGSVTSIQVADQLEKLGFEVNRKMIGLPGNIKEIGQYVAKVRLHKDITVEIPFAVESDDPNVVAKEEAPAKEEEKEVTVTEEATSEEATETTEA